MIDLIDPISKEIPEPKEIFTNDLSRSGIHG